MGFAMVNKLHCLVDIIHFVIPSVCCVCLFSTSSFTTSFTSSSLWLVIHQLLHPLFGWSFTTSFTLCSVVHHLLNPINSFMGSSCFCSPLLQLSLASWGSRLHCSPFFWFIQSVMLLPVSGKSLFSRGISSLLVVFVWWFVCRHEEYSWAFFIMAWSRDLNPSPPFNFQPSTSFFSKTQGHGISKGITLTQFGQNGNADISTTPVLSWQQLDTWSKLQHSSWKLIITGHKTRAGQKI